MTDSVLDVVVFVVALVEHGLPWQEHVLLQQLDVQLLVLSGDICHWQILDLFREVLLEAVSEVGHSVFDHVLEPQVYEIRIAFADFYFYFDLQLRGLRLNVAGLILELVEHLSNVVKLSEQGVPDHVKVVDLLLALHFLFAAEQLERRDLKHLQYTLPSVFGFAV